MTAESAPLGNKRRDLLPGLLLGGVCLALFWPLLSWLFSHTLAHDQLQNTVIITVAAVAACVWKRSSDLHTRWELSNTSIYLIAGALLLVGLAGYLKRPEPVILGLLCAVAGMARFIWGETARILLRPALVGLAGFFVLLVLMPTLDWPLRTLAGANAAEILIKLGLAPQLKLVQEAEGAWQLVLFMGKNAFIVAPECNGFGLISSCLLLALILAQASDEPAWWKALTLPVSVMIAFLFNLARILAITLLAQRFPGREAYDFIHETAGTVALWAGLGAVWWLSGFRLFSNNASPSAPPSTPCSPTSQPSPSPSQTS